MRLSEATIGTEYVVKEITTNDEQLQSFLFSLGLYGGESVTVVTRRRKNLVMVVKDARYSIDNQLAEAILLKNMEGTK